MNPLLQLAMAAALLSSSAAAETGPALPPPVDLRCDGRLDPLSSPSQPKLTWRIDSEQRGLHVSSWQVLVATREDLLLADKGDLWDSGRQPTERSWGVRYEGRELHAGVRCHWKVRWWNSGDMPSAWSAPAVWEVAPVKPADWQGARWMNDGRENPEKDEDFYRDDPAPLMRREFTITKPVLRARLHVAGLGLCLPSLNGKPLVDHVFDPPWTNFDKRVLFRTHDVTGQVMQGDNCIGLELGNGWYNPLPLRMWGHRNIRGSMPVGRPRAIACLVIEHPDGSKTTVTSGEAWTTTPGPTLRNSIYLGEKRDARLSQDGWNTAGFSDADWKPVALTEDTLDPLQPLQMPPARLLQPLAAKKITSPADGIHIVDFGENFTGLPEVTLKAPAGTRITLRFGELLHEDGTLNPMTSVCGQIKGNNEGPDGKPVSKGGPGAPEIAWQQSVYIADGSGEEIFQPRFTFHSFRYMEITGLPAAPELSNCRAFPMHTDLASAGSFSSSNDDLNRIQEMCRRTFLANVVTVQSDCPHRERFGYGGDIVATSEAYLMNFDMAGFYAKTVRDWADSVRPDGRLTDTAPFVGIDYCGVGWAMVHPLLIEQLYQFHGDRALVEEQLPVAIRWLEVEAAARKDGIVTKGLGDHESLAQGKGPEFLTPMFIDSAMRVARLCRVVGQEEDAARFEQMAGESAGAWSVEFLDEKSGKVGVGTQSAQTFALAYGTLLEPARDKVFDFLLADLNAPKDAPRLTTGIFGTLILLEQLSRHGRSDLAYDLANRESFPSWKWMLKNGATTLWEHWEGSDNTYSNNHPMFGSVSTWFFRWLGGIQCADDAVAFDRVLIRPQVVDGLEWVKSSHQSVRGLIKSDWSDDGEVRRFQITIPPGTTASVTLPARAGDFMKEGGKPAEDGPGIKILDSPPTLRRIELGSGAYDFTLSAIR